MPCILAQDIRHDSAHSPLFGQEFLARYGATVSLHIPYSAIFFPFSQNSSLH
jgi:hypothetical protein